ncbi:MAG: transposase [Patescibacteria group bacterium]
MLRYDPNSLNSYHAPFIVDLLGYSLMPNHFHLIVKQNTDNGLSRFANRIQDSYTKYFNTRYDRVGHLLQGPYQFIRVETNDHLLHVLRYVHLNAPVADLSVDAFDYPWSSARHYLDPELILPLDTSLVLALLPRSKFVAFHSDYQDYARSLNTIKHLVLE